MLFDQVECVNISVFIAQRSLWMTTVINVVPVVPNEDNPEVKSTPSRSPFFYLLRGFGLTGKNGDQKEEDEDD